MSAHPAFDDPTALILETIRCLESCPGPHEFVFEIPEHIKPRQKYAKCVRCGAIIQKSSALWYMTGLKHGRQERR